MKPIFTLLAVLCTAATGYAQHHKQLKEQTAHAIALNAQAGGSTAKTTANKQRLTRKVFLNTGGAIYDSSVYRYDFGRGSEFDFYYLVYNEWIEPQFGNRKAVLFDSADNFFVAGSSGIDYAGNTPVRQVTFRTPGLSERRTFSYNAAGQVAACQLEHGFTTWHIVRMSYYLYDAHGRLILDSADAYHQGNHIGPEQRTEYHYNQQGLLDTTTYSEYNVWDSKWEWKDRYIFGYTGTQITRSFYQTFPGIKWFDQWKTEMTYTGDQRISELYYDWNGTNWELSTEEYRHLNTNNLPDSIFTRYISSADTHIRKISYTSFGNPDTIRTYQTAANQNYEEQFFYEEYDPTAVPGRTSVRAMVVYPNPAKICVMVAAENLPYGKVQYSIANTTGQEVAKGRSDVIGGTVKIDIHDLPLGTYWLQLQDAKGERYKAAFSKVE